MSRTLHTLPVEIVYRILDNLNSLTILCSMRNVCTRLNAITDSYQQYQNLTELKLSTNIITAVQLKCLAEALYNNDTITTVIFNYQQIDGHLKTVKGLADALQYNRSIITLNLYNNQIGDNGAKHFANALKHSITLTTLDLSCNLITSEGIQHLANALKTNQTLTTIDLSVNEIEGKGAQYLADALEHNKTLKTLDLSLNYIGHEGAKHLANALEHNITLTKVNLKYNGIGSTIPWYLREEMEKNPARVKI